MENLSEIKKYKNTEIDSRTSMYFERCSLTKSGNIVVFNGFLKNNFNQYINIAGTVLFELPFKPQEETWVEPYFTIKKNGYFEVGAHGIFEINKFKNPRHLNFTYICE